MGKTGHGDHGDHGGKVEKHQDHHDHHDHHDDHHHDQYQLRHDIPPTRFPTYKPKGDNDPLDFSKKHPLYNIQLEKKGPEFSEIDDRRQEYIQKYAGKVPYVEIHVPKNIAGLVPRVGELPANRKLWRSSSSLQRSGAFNMYTHHFGTRFIIPFVFVTLIYGYWQPPMLQNYTRLEQDNQQVSGNFYDKLNFRATFNPKIWLRPG